MANPPFRAAYSPAFQKQYSKLTNANKDLADEAIKNLIKLVNMDPNSEEAKHTARGLRTKVIQKFKRKKPRRMEATFAPDGRIVWMVDGKLLRLLYIGNHSVLDKD